MIRNKNEWKTVSPNALVKEWLIEKYTVYKYTVIIDTSATASKITPIAVAITGLPSRDVTSVVNKAYRVNGAAADVKGKRMISKYATNKRTGYLRFRTQAEAEAYINSLNITAAQKALLKIEEL